MEAVYKRCVRCIDTAVYCKSRGGMATPRGHTACISVLLYTKIYSTLLYYTKLHYTILYYKSRGGIATPRGHTACNPVLMYTSPCAFPSTLFLSPRRALLLQVAVEQQARLPCHVGPHGVPPGQKQKQKQENIHTRTRRKNDQNI